MLPMLEIKVCGLLDTKKGTVSSNRRNEILLQELESILSTTLCVQKKCGGYITSRLPLEKSHLRVYSDRILSTTVSQIKTLCLVSVPLD